MGSNDGPWKPIGDGVWVGTDASTRFPIYTRGNAGEVYPEVYRPLSFSIAQQAGERAMRNAVLATGFIRPDEIADVPLTTGLAAGTFGGYSYLNLSLQRTISGRVPGGKPTDADASFLGLSEAPPHVARPGDRNWRASVSGMWRLWRTTRVTSLPRLADDQQTVASYLASLPDPASATDAELRDAIGDDLLDMFSELFQTHLEVSFAAGALMSLLTQLCERRLDDGALALRLVSGLGDVDSAAPSASLWELGRRVAAEEGLAAEFDRGVHGLHARLVTLAGLDDAPRAVVDFVEAFGRFVDEFGARGPNEWDTAFDTWETDPDLALAVVDRMRFTDASHDPALQQRRLADERHRAHAAARAELPRPLRRFFDRLVRATTLHMQSRERTKTTVVRAIHGARLLAQELDRRLVQRSGGIRGDLWFLLDTEIDRYVQDPASCADLIAERRRMHALLRERRPPFVFDGEPPPLAQWERRDAAVAPVEVGDTLVGLGGCAGVATGRARVVLDPSDPRGLEPGDVLVAPLTDPSWTPLFVPADAVVVDVGAPMSHAVIVSRELGIPCAVSVTDATRRIPDGAVLCVDGGTGAVTVVSLPDRVAEPPGERPRSLDADAPR